jgi:hypothetical protein
MKCDFCEGDRKEYPASHGPWVPAFDVKDGQRFSIPDYHGGYGWCCVNGEAAEYEHHSGDVFESYFKCVKCGEKTLYCNTFIQTVELR